MFLGHLYLSAYQYKSQAAVCALLSSRHRAASFAQSHMTFVKICQNLISVVSVEEFSHVLYLDVAKHYFLDR